MRAEKLKQILELALTMQATAEGLSFQDIQSRFAVSRRTAERWRDVIAEVFPQTEAVDGEGRQKRWRLPRGTLRDAVGFSADELGHLRAATEVLRREGLAAQAEALNGILAKLRALMSPGSLARVDPDLEALAEAEGIAWRPGPRVVLRPEIVGSLREAIKGRLKVRIRYRARHGDGGARQHTLCPYGFLYGMRHYLVAAGTRKGRTGVVKYALSGVEQVTVLDVSFVRDPGFSLKTYAARSFGVWDEEPFETVWRFSPDAAPNARQYMFHPSQVMTDQEDGSLVVRLTAGSDLEMALHLMTWGEGVEVVKPVRLRRLVERDRTRAA
jgi:predicted DNA-binding transcriptional regulator YafY